MKNYCLSEKWKNIEKIIIYGYGRVARNNLSYFTRNFQVICIVDSDARKCGGTYEGIPVKHFEEVKEQLSACKIIIMTAERNAHEIGKKLEQIGLREYEDFCSLECFVTEWFLRFQQKVCLMELHTSITTRCTLKCRKCNMFMPYYQRHTDYTAEDIQGDVDTLFNHVDYVFTYMLLGGEPLLHKELPDLLEYIGSHYRDRIGTLGIITNGTLLPDQSLLEVSKKYDVHYSISDYTAVIPYEKRLNELIELFQKHQIYFERNQADYWCDFGFPECSAAIDKNRIKEHMLACGPIFHGLNDKKIFYCHVAWSADKCGLFGMTDNDYLDLTKLDVQSADDKRKIVEHCRGRSDRGYTGLCAVCGGCGNDNKQHIDVAEQWKR